MIKEVEKQAKIALCRECGGAGRHVDVATGQESECEQCGGSGRVTVSARIRFDIRPYKPRAREDEQETWSELPKASSRHKPNIRHLCPHGIVGS